MKIILLGTAWPYRGGLATFNERLARQFACEGHEVEVWTFTLQYPSFLFPGKTQYTSEPAPEDLIIRRELNSCNPFNWWRVGRAIRKAAPDLLICCYWMSFFAPAYGLVSRIAQRNGKTKCIALVHNMIPHEPSILDKLFAPYFVKSQNGFVALSDSVVGDIDRLDKAGKPKTFSPHPIYDHYGERMTKAEACEALNLPSDKAYMLYLMGKYKEAIGLYDILIPYAIERKDKYKKELKSLYAERGFAKRRSGDSTGANSDFLSSEIDMYEIDSYEPKFSAQGFMVDKF